LSLDHRSDALDQQITDVGLQRPDAQLQLGVVRDHVGGDARVKGTDRDHRAIQRVDVARDDTLQRLDNRRAGEDGVGGLVWHRPMTAHALDGDGQGVGGRHERTGQKTELACWQSRHVVHRKYGVTGK
jgi:hypothetical protein